MNKNTLELIELFRNSMADEIYQASLNEASETSLITALDEVKAMVIDTYYAEK